jgi:hypothetical protein
LRMMIFPLISRMRFPVPITDESSSSESFTRTYSTWTYNATYFQSHSQVGGVMMRMSGGPVAYKACLHPTIAGSSTEAEFI